MLLPLDLEENLSLKKIDRDFPEVCVETEAVKNMRCAVQLVTKKNFKKIKS